MVRTDLVSCCGNAAVSAPMMLQHSNSNNSCQRWNTTIVKSDKKNRLGVKEKPAEKSYPLNMALVQLNLGQEWNRELGDLQDPEKSFKGLAISI